MLPQGRFQAFLRARSEERHALLQQVFRTERFDRIERWLRERRVALRRASDAHRGTVADLVSRVSEAATPAARRLAGRPLRARGCGELRLNRRPRRGSAVGATRRAEAEPWPAAARRRGREPARGPPTVRRRARPPTLARRTAAARQRRPARRPAPTRRAAAPCVVRSPDRPRGDPASHPRRARAAPWRSARRGRRRSSLAARRRATPWSGRARGGRRSPPGRAPLCHRGPGCARWSDEVPRVQARLDAARRRARPTRDPGARCRPASPTSREHGADRPRRRGPRCPARAGAGEVASSGAEALTERDRRSRRGSRRRTRRLARRARAGAASREELLELRQARLDGMAAEIAPEPGRRRLLPGVRLGRPPAQGAAAPGAPGRRAREGRPRGLDDAKADEQARDQLVRDLETRLAVAAPRPATRCDKLPRPRPPGSTALRAAAGRPLEASSADWRPPTAEVAGSRTTS